MDKSPGMMIDPNGEMTKYAEPVQDGDYAVHGGMDAVAVRAYMANGAHMMYGRFFMLGMNTIMAAGGGGGNSMVGGPVTGRGNINRLMSIVKMIDLASRSGMFKNSNIVDVIAGLYNSGYDPGKNEIDDYNFTVSESKDGFKKLVVGDATIYYRFQDNIYEGEKHGVNLELYIKVKGSKRVEVIQTIHTSDNPQERWDGYGERYPFYHSEKDIAFSNEKNGIGGAPMRDNFPGSQLYYSDFPGRTSYFYRNQGGRFEWNGSSVIVAQINGIWVPVFTFYWSWQYKEGKTTSSGPRQEYSVPRSIGNYLKDIK